MRRLGLPSLILGTGLVVVLLLRGGDETHAEIETLAADRSPDADRSTRARPPRENWNGAEHRAHGRAHEAEPPRIQLASPPESFEGPEAELAWYRHALETSRRRKEQVAGLRERIEASDPPAPVHVRDGIVRDQTALDTHIRDLEQRLAQLERAPKRPHPASP